MIQIYLQNNTNFEKNGNITLFPSECIVSANLNSDWTLNLKHPIDCTGRWKFITNGAVIKVPSFNGEQLFRIYNTDLNNLEVAAEAYPIFLDACNDTFLLDIHPTNVNGQDALNRILKGTRYSGSSNIKKLSTAYYQKQNVVNAINGDIDQSFINRWGGQIIYDNFKIIINNYAGGDYGVTLRYGKNIVGMSQKINRGNLCTRIVPQAYNGYMLEGDSPWVDSPLISSYPIPYVRVIKFEDIKLKKDAQEDEDAFSDMASLQAELRRRSNLMFSEENIDKENVTLDIDVELLENTEEYKQFPELEKISLGDFATCINSKLGIAVKTQAISLIYDCIQKKTTNVVLGQFQPNYFNNNTLIENKVEKNESDLNNLTSSVNDVEHKVKKIINTEGSINASEIEGIIDAAKAQMKVQSTAAEKQDVRAILFEDLDPNSDLYGALAIGTKGIQIAKNRTPDERDWEWETAITAKGVVSDELVGEYIKGIAIEAVKGNIAGFEIASSGLKKVWKKQGDNGKYYNLIFEISSISGSSSDNFIIKLMDEGAGSYTFSVTDTGHLYIDRIVAREALFETLNVDFSVEAQSLNLNDSTSPYFGTRTTPFKAVACDSPGRWRQIKWYIDSGHIGVLEPLDQSGTEDSTCWIGKSDHRWNRIYLYHPPYTVSDPKKKKNIEPFNENTIQFLKEIQPYYYNMKTEEDGSPKHMGFMAPDISEVASRTIGNIFAANYDKKGGWSLTYEELIAPLMYGVNYAINKIERLEEELKNAGNSKINTGC